MSVVEWTPDDERKFVVGKQAKHQLLSSSQKGHVCIMYTCNKHFWKFIRSRQKFIATLEMCGSSALSKTLCSRVWPAQPLSRNHWGVQNPWPYNAPRWLEYHSRYFFVYGPDWWGDFGGCTVVCLSVLLDAVVLNTKSGEYRK